MQYRTLHWLRPLQQPLPFHVKQQQRMQEIKAYFGKLSMSKIC